MKSFGAQRASLIELLYSIQAANGMDQETIVMFVHMLDNRRKINRFVDWVKAGWQMASCMRPRLISAEPLCR